MKNEIVVNETAKIEDLIYEVRGKQVMLDSDLAILYGCKNGTNCKKLAEDIEFIYGARSSNVSNSFKN